MFLKILYLHQLMHLEAKNLPDSLASYFQIGAT